MSCKYLQFVLVATSVAEEALDVAECSLIIKYNSVGSEKSYTQQRGRARAINARSILLAISTFVEQQEYNNIMREYLINICLNELQNLREHELQKRIFEKKEELKAELEQERKRQAQRKERNVSYILECKTCGKNLCKSNQVARLMESQFICCNDAAWTGTRIEQRFQKAFSNKVSSLCGEWKCVKCNTKLGEVIKYGEAYLPTLSVTGFRLITGKLDGQNVAIKMALREGRKSIHKELQIYDKVSHPHILPALGIHLGVENLLFMPLRKFNLADYFIDYGVTIQADKLYRYCVQISSAVKYLHENEILHCDIKVDNILVKDDDGEELEISDFGCAVDLSHDREVRYSGTITHTAYELIKDYMNPEIKGKGSKASDVWAFAVTVWQIYNKSGRIPNDFIAPREILNNYEKGKKLPKPAEMPDRMWRYLILQCFDLQQTGRPTMKEIHEKLTTKDF